MGKPHGVTLDPLPLKRVLALEESGLELYPPEASQEEKPLSLLQSLDFERTAEKEAKKAKTGKDGAATQQAWPWQGLLEHFQQAREELMTLLDFIANVEANEALAVANMMKPKPLPNEFCADLALRIASKSHEYKDVGKYLKRNAKALERQVERESVFYGALMRLQRNWKIKRQRGVSAGPGGKAGFVIDLSFPLSFDVSLISSPRTAPLTLIKVDQDSNGLLQVQLPAGRNIGSLQLHIGDSLQIADSKESSIEKRVIESGEEREGGTVDEGTRLSNLRLRHIQASMLDELIFECLLREALQPSSGTSLVGIGETFLHVGLGESLAALFKLSTEPLTEIKNAKNEAVKERPFEISSRICLRQAFYSMLLASQAQTAKSAVGPKGGISKDEAANLLRQFSGLIRHRLSGEKICSLLDKMVLEVPQFWFLSHPTWRPAVSAWDVYFDIPQVILKGGQTKYQEWNSLVRVTRVTFQCTLVLRQETFTIEGLDGCMPLGTPKKSGHESTEMTSCVCSITELPLFLLTQIAGKIVKWLEEEALLMGSRVKRNFLSIVFDTENSGHVSLVAAPSGCCINWWLRLYADDTAYGKEKGGDSSTPTSERFLGRLPLETLRAVVMDLLNLTKDCK